MKRVIVTILAVMAAVALAGCSSSSGASQSAPDKGKKEITIVESGYSFNQHGYASYALQLHNESKTDTAYFPVVTATAKNADGTIAFTKDWTLTKIDPDETAFYASMAGQEGTSSDVSVEFSVSVADDKWKAGKTHEGERYTISNVSEPRSQYGASPITGEITLNTDEEGADQPIVVAVLRDESGKIVSGVSTFITQSPLVKGEAKAFQINGYQLPEHSSVEVYANPWSMGDIMAEVFNIKKSE